MSNLSTYTSLAGMTVMGTGTYTGNNSQNRAIPHGLSVTPYVVLLYNTTDNDSIELIMGTLDVHLTNAAPTTYAMTAIDGTNIYVGTAAVFYGNVTAKNYRWVALGQHT